MCGGWQWLSGRRDARGWLSSAQSRRIAPAVRALVIAGIIIVGVCAAVPSGVAAAPTDVNATQLPGSGTATDPYVITNATELQAMEDDLTAHYELGSDVDASATAQWNGGSGFTPIGNDSAEFTGRFDGGQHTIANLSIDRRLTASVSSAWRDKQQASTTFDSRT